MPADAPRVRKIAIALKSLAKIAGYAVFAGKVRTGGARKKLAMRHRHLTDADSTSLMALDDILDRGSPADWHELVRLVQRDPFGPVSEKILHLCRSHAMYGTSSLWPAIVERLRRAAP